MTSSSGSWWMVGGPIGEPTGGGIGYLVKISQTDRAGLQGLDFSRQTEDLEAKYRISKLAVGDDSKFGSLLVVREKAPGIQIASQTAKDGLGDT